MEITFITKRGSSYSKASFAGLKPHYWQKHFGVVHDCQQFHERVLWDEVENQCTFYHNANNVDFSTGTSRIIDGRIGKITSKTWLHAVYCGCNIPTLLCLKQEWANSGLRGACGPPRSSHTCTLFGNSETDNSWSTAKLIYRFVELPINRS